MRYTSEMYRHGFRFVNSSVSSGYIAAHKTDEKKSQLGSLKVEAIGSFHSRFAIDLIIT